MSTQTAGFDAESQATPSLPTSPSLAKKRRRSTTIHESHNQNGGGFAELENLLKREDCAELLEGGEEQPHHRLFREFSSRLRNELAPSSFLEEILVDRVVQSAWRMQTAMQAERIWTLHQSTNQHLLIPERLRCQPLNELRRDTKAAEASLGKAMANLDRHRSMNSPQWGKAAKTDPREAPRPSFDIEPKPHDSIDPSAQAAWDTAQDNPDQAPAPATTTSTTRANPPRWQDRLVYDFNVSDRSPVVKGTWVTVNHIVTLIVDGWTWADILRSHPELTENDIRICLAFATSGDGLEA